MARAPARPSVRPMTTPTPAPTLRESVDDLGERLARIGAAASILRSLALDIKHGIPPTALVQLTEDLERDLLLASTQLDALHDRARLELSSLRETPGAR